MIESIESFLQPANDNIPNELEPKRPDQRPVKPPKPTQKPVGEYIRGKRQMPRPPPRGSKK